MAAKVCGATFGVDEELAFSCALPPGHAGPVHRDNDGQEWGDVFLPPPDEGSA